MVKTASADDVHEDRKATELVRKEQKEFKTVMNITYNLHYLGWMILSKIFPNSLEMSR